MYIGNEIMLVTRAYAQGKQTRCYGIIFNGELDSVKSYFTEDKEPIEYEGVAIKIGDLVPVDAKKAVVDEFYSKPVKERINNIVTLFGGIKKCAEEKIPEYMHKNVLNENNRKYAWQYMHAVQDLCASLRSLEFDEKHNTNVKNVKDVCMENFIYEMHRPIGNLDKNLSKKEDYALVEKTMEALKIANNVPDKYYAFKTPVITLCDQTHDDYVLVTGRNEDKTVNGVMLTNLSGKSDGRGSLKYVTSMPCKGGFPLLGDLIGVEQKDDEQILNKEDIVPKKIEERIDNLYFLNDLLFEHYFQNDPKEFSQTVYNAQTHLTKALTVLLNDYVMLPYENIGKEEENRGIIYSVLAKNLHQEVLECKSLSNIDGMKALNKNVNLTKPMVDLPKVALGNNKAVQKTLDMF